MSKKDWRLLCAYLNTGYSPEQVLELAARNKELQARVMAPPMVEVNCYDKEEIFEGCTIQVLTNTATGAVSVGWWHGTAEDMPGRCSDG